MKNVLITGKDSYIGTSVESWLLKDANQYRVHTIDMKDESWVNHDFTQFDTVFHVAALVHTKELPDMKDVYFRVNRDLPIQVAKKAKREGVNQFIFMSTMAVYGEEGSLGAEVIIDINTPVNPKSLYSVSKYEAEIELMKLNDNHFKVVILRPPMVYGPNCPGNYARLEKFASKIPVFPYVDNKRSMIHMDKLSQYVKQYIDGACEGLYLPQDDHYVCTSLMVKELAKEQGKPMHLSRFLGWMILVFGKRISIVHKVFGNLVYKQEA